MTILQQSRHAQRYKASQANEAIVWSFVINIMNCRRHYTTLDCLVLRIRVYASSKTFVPLGWYHKVAFTHDEFFTTFKYSALNPIDFDYSSLVCGIIVSDCALIGTHPIKFVSDSSKSQRLMYDAAVGPTACPHSSHQLPSS